MEEPILVCYQCECAVKYNNPYSLRNHSRADHLELRFECKVCYNRFRTAAILTDHMVEDHNKQREFSNPSMCVHCNMKRFTNPEGLKKHNARAHKSYELLCKGCGNVFKWPDKKSGHVCP